MGKKVFAVVFLVFFSLTVFAQQVNNDPVAIITGVSEVPTTLDNINVACDDGIEDDCSPTMKYYFTLEETCSSNETDYAQTVTDADPTNGIGGFLVAAQCPLQQGFKHLCLWVEDTAGNSDTNKSELLHMDCTAPSCSIISPTASNPFFGDSFDSTQISFSIVEENPSSYQLSVENGSLSTPVLCNFNENLLVDGAFLKTCNWSQAQAGNYDVRLTVTDEAQQAITCNNSGAVRIDTGPQNNTPPYFNSFNLQMFANNPGIENAFNLNDLAVDDQDDDLSFQLSNGCSSLGISVVIDSQENIDITTNNVDLDNETTCTVGVTAREVSTQEQFVETGEFTIQILTTGYLEVTIRENGTLPFPLYSDANSADSALEINVNQGDNVNVEVHIENNLNPLWATKPADIYFVVDATPTFQDELDALEASIELINTNLTNLYAPEAPCQQNDDCLRYGVTIFGGTLQDGSPNSTIQNGAWTSVADTQGLTNDVQTIKDTINLVNAGGVAQEPWFDYFYRVASEANWRDETEAVRVVVVITDVHSNWDEQIIDSFTTSNPPGGCTINPNPPPIFFPDAEFPNIFCTPPYYYPHYRPIDFENVFGLQQLKTLSEARNIVVAGLYQDFPGGNGCEIAGYLEGFKQAYQQCPIDIQLPYLCTATNGVCESYTDSGTFADKLSDLLSNLLPDTIQISPALGFSQDFDDEWILPNNQLTIDIRRGETADVNMMFKVPCDTPGDPECIANVPNQKLFGYTAVPLGVTVVGDPYLTDDFYFWMNISPAQQSNAVIEVVSTEPFFEGSGIWFNASNSTCAGGQGLEDAVLTWSFVNGGVDATCLPVNVTKNGLVVPNVFPDNGTYTVNLSLLCANGDTDQASVQVEVLNAAPRPKIESSFIFAGQYEPVNFIGTVTDPGVCDMPSAGWNTHWDFGDGDTASDNPIVHAWNFVGAYSVALSSTDKDGDTGTGYKTIFITDQLDVFRTRVYTTWESKDCSQPIKKVFGDENLRVCFTISNVYSQSVNLDVNGSIIDAVTGQQILNLTNSLLDSGEDPQNLDLNSGQTKTWSWTVELDDELFPEESYAVRIRALPPPSETIVSNNFAHSFFTVVGEVERTGVPETDFLVVVLTAMIVLVVLQKKKI